MTVATPNAIPSHASTINVSTLPTPNPDALMFRVDEALVPTGTYEYHLGQPTADSPLATRLFQIDGVEMVLIAPRFVTVGKVPSAEWPEIVPFAKNTLRELLANGEMAVVDEALATVATGSLSDLERRILQLIDDEIRPAIAGDGGDVVYGGLEDGVVRLQLIGSCGTCPSSTATLKGGIERMLMEEFPEIRAVEQI